MNTSAVGGVSAAAFDRTYGVAVAKKSLDAQKQSGESAVQLIQSAAAPPVKPGHSLSVMA
jgi:hypothetical protein